ncbi:hypothetical protein Leryth_018081 [Lithospermum erythrorhizon]|nr:hypothetical protein Leryth_018081 [Lithospermum erythrorhizon]
MASSVEDEHLIWKILLTHDPDEKNQLDSGLLLRAVENVICSAAPEMSHHLSLKDYTLPNGGTRILESQGIKMGETLGYSLFEMQNKILFRCFEDQDLHDQVMIMFEMLGHFEWHAKVALVLAVLGISYGEFWLMIQFRPQNRLAAILAALKNCPRDLGMFKREFEALAMLINMMVEVSRTIIELESLPLQPGLLEDKVYSAAKAKIYMATYWIFRSSITCSYFIAGLRAIRHDQVYSVSRVITAGSIFRLVQKLKGFLSDLKDQLKICRHPTESRLYENLQNIFKETRIDNQEALRMLFALKYDFPFKDFHTQEKCGIRELKDKVVILLITKPEFLSIEKVFFLTQQMDDHLNMNKLEGKSALLWIPISSSGSWNNSDEVSYQWISSSFPCLSLRQPWSLNQVVVRYIKQEWNFEEDPIMVLIDVNGKVTNLDAIDMVWIWGAKAFPFSTSRELELWEQQNVLLHIIIDEIDPLLTKWVEGGYNICIYASNDLDWIREFNSAISVMKAAGIQLEAVYVGWTNPGENVKNVQKTIHQERLSLSISFMKMRYFWLRLESIKKSIHKFKNEEGFDVIANELSGLLDFDDNDKGWALFGTGSSPDVAKLKGENFRRCFEFVPVWAKHVKQIGLAKTIKNALELSPLNKLCKESEFLEYEEGVAEKGLICSQCRRPMEAFVVYRCDESDQEHINLE